MTELKTTSSLGLLSPCLPFSQHTGQNHDGISKSPILNLHNDILWWIFWLNTDMEDETEEENGIAAIDTLRYSSQVCSRWRQIILLFSSLWGQVINLSRLGHDDWREEVLRRRGRSFLSVLWHPSRYACLSVEVVIEILRGHWDKIRWLDLDFTAPYWVANGFDLAQFWEVLQRPSEVLETLRIIFKSMDPEGEPILSPPNFVIFNNLAPVLRIFYAPSVKFNLDAPWLTNLRFLALNGQVSAYDVVQAILRMPFLEFLEDSTSNAITCTGDALSSAPHITAPSIKTIALNSSSNIGPYMDFLAQIKPPAGCYLRFSHTGRVFDAKTLSLANHVLYTYSRCCDFPSAIKIYLDLEPYCFGFEALIPHKGLFSFKIRYNTELPCDITHTLLEALPSVKFQDAETLTLRISSLISKPSDSKITQLIVSASSIKTLITDPETLAVLLNLPVDILALSFPLLHTVEIIFCLVEELSTIKQFLKSRISTGRPIDVLSMPIDLDLVESCRDLRSLDEFTGLTIIIQCVTHGEESEHICGSGHIEDLLFISLSQGE